MSLNHFYKNIMFSVVVSYIIITAAKRTDTRGVGISSTRKSIYLLTTTSSSHTHTGVLKISLAGANK